MTPDASTEPASGLAIIGGGLTGLVAAHEAVKRGEQNIVVYEASNRLGGKIQSGVLGNTIINRGAEFIDSDHKHLIALARDMGCNLVENKGMERETFIDTHGKPMAAEAFYATYAPYARFVIADREEIKQRPDGPRAAHLSSLSLDQYVAQMQARVTPAPRGFWGALKDAITFHGNSNQQIAQIAAKSYASEAGQPIGNIGALQFIAETSDTPDTFLSSDCKWRVEGGTEQIITKLRETLAAKGVTFQTGAELNKIAKLPDGKLSLVFKNTEYNRVADKTILALPSYAFKEIHGLESLGLSPQSAQLLADTQYTNSFKMTVAFKPGMAPPEGAFYSPDGFQCWSPGPGYLTFLSNADGIGNKPAKQVIMERLQSYAAANGSTADKMFDLTQLDYNNPGHNACYATPKPGQARALESIKAELPALAQHGVGMAGTFLPLDGNFGFMECGLVSAKQAVAMVADKDKATDLTPQKQWAHHVEQQRAANDNSLAIRA